MTGKVESPSDSLKKTAVGTAASIPAEPSEIEKKSEPVEVDALREKMTAAGIQPTNVVDDKPPSEGYRKMQEKIESDLKPVKEALEQRIGILWLLIAGIFTTLVATGYFLRYAYVNNWIPAWGRVLIIVGFGALALGLGEWTRRRDYGIVARGLTSMGFAIMYGAVFASSSYYHLFNTTVALSLSILVTVGAMLYAMGMNEILAAFMSLVGGYLSPIIISTGENRPHALFGYVSILSIGAMACAIFRKWRAVSILAFLGTFGLYTGWFEKFYRPAMRLTPESTPEQLSVALVWLSVFFVIFLIMPILYELKKKITAKKEDVVLLVANSAVVFYYLCTILFENYRTSLAIACLVAGACHMGLKFAVGARNRQDTTLRLVLEMISIFFVTIALPMYLKMYALALAWAGEGVILVGIGIFYRNTWIRGAGMVALILSVFGLAAEMPPHTTPFSFLFNSSFGSWVLVAATFYITHILYRQSTNIKNIEKTYGIQISFGVFWVLLLAATMMEWYYYSHFNLIRASGYSYSYYLLQGYPVILTVFMLLLLLKPISPPGAIWRVGATGLGTIIIMMILCGYSYYFVGRHWIFINSGFFAGITGIAGLFLAALLIRRHDPKNTECQQVAFGILIAGIFSLWIMLTEEIFFYWKHVGIATSDIQRCTFLGQMYISVMWAIYAGILMGIGFWKKSHVLRYISLVLFLLIISKVFIFDMSNIQSVYRIAGFGVLGITLIGISYLYQYGKKKGMFLEMMPQAKAEDAEK
ncbi:MAG: DUF2339 domain-containing protein [Planctomycetes bacterium]|nr:DUF2339 domain-containing protein [Planctomycetota bacterium]